MRIRMLNSVDSYDLSQPAVLSQTYRIEPKLEPHRRNYLFKTKSPTESENLVYNLALGRILPNYKFNDSYFEE